MTYRYEKNGQIRERELNFDPTVVGFEYVDTTSCCVMFKKKVEEDDVWRIRVKNDSGLLFLEHCADEEIDKWSYNKMRMTRPIASQEEFLTKIKKWISN